ncbi:MAG: RluA family pseudouridine synthase [Candidatus Brocadiia bacterium]|nr:MAG: RluA family pseudouridine synthase [Candidatus Brocadiia bacterium]
MPKQQIEIIFENNGLLVVNKPTGVSVTADRSGAPQLTDILPGQIGQNAVDQLRLIHRLDKQTSGVMILAKTLEAQTEFSTLFEKRLVKKTYLAIVTGAVMAPAGIINAPLGQHPKDPQLIRVDRRKGKESITEWTLLANFGTLSLLAVKPLTGRTHQIRVHLPSVSMPLAIDPLYGSLRPILLSEFKTDYMLGKGHEEKPLIDRLTLHAYQIEFENHAPDTPQYFVAGLDKKFQATLKMLAKYTAAGPMHLWTQLFSQKF